MVAVAAVWCGKVNVSSDRHTRNNQERTHVIVHHVGGRYSESSSRGADSIPLKAMSGGTSDQSMVKSSITTTLRDEDRGSNL